MISSLISTVDHSTLQLIGAFFVFTVLVIPYLTTSIGFSKIPLIGNELGNSEKRRKAYLTTAKDLYAQGYNKFKNGVFRITTQDDCRTLVLSPGHLDELKRLPDDVVSMNAAVEDLLETKYTKMATRSDMVVHVIKADLTPGLRRLNDRIASEVDYCLRSEMPPCDDWTKVNIHQKLLRMVAQISGHVFIGPECAHSEEFIEAAVMYTVEMMQAQQAIKRMRPILRRFYSQGLPEIKKVQARVQQFSDFIRPVILNRIAASESPGYQAPDDMLQWMLEKADKFNVDKYVEFGRLQLALSFAAIHTTTLTATNVFYDLAARPEYTAPLRDEINAALNASNGLFSVHALQNMPKLDSFVRESMRQYPLGFTSFRRKVLKGFYLSTGLYIPKNTIIEVPSDAVHHDPDNISNPQEFDGFRFSKKTAESSARNASRNQVVSVTPDHLHFGYGNHACPGRFFAANEIKMIIIKTLLAYDISLVDGQKERYPNFNFGSSSSVDPTKELLFKKVVV